MPIDLTVLPEKIRAKAVEMSANIDFLQLIQKGGNGHVLIGRNRVLDRNIVVKFYYWGNGDHAEPAHLAQMQSDSILTVSHAEALDEEDAFFMTPFCEHGDLDDAIARGMLGPVEAVDALLQIASGVSYLHAEGYLHRDLKPSNIFCVEARRLVLGDFGSVVRKNSEGFAQTVTRHALLYRPPEEIRERRSYEQGDIYQLGLILFQLLGGRLPYEEVNWLTARQRREYDAKGNIDCQLYATEIIERLITRGRLADMATLPAWVPSLLIATIRKCLRGDKDARFQTASDLIANLNNIRGKLPDWRIEDGIPVLRRARAAFRLLEVKGCIQIEKLINGSPAWRRERALKPRDLVEAVKMAEGLS